jgi:hypothetical protein
VIASGQAPKKWQYLPEIHSIPFGFSPLYSGVSLSIALRLVEKEVDPGVKSMFMR